MMHRPSSIRYITLIYPLQSPVVCGGMDSFHERQTHCYRMGSTDNEWADVGDQGDMATERARFATAVVGDKMYILGG